MITRLTRIGLVAVLAIAAAPVAAQQVRGLESFSAPQAESTPVPTPPAPVIVLPTATPTPTPAPISEPGTGSTSRPRALQTTEPVRRKPEAVTQTPKSEPVVVPTTRTMTSEPVSTPTLSPTPSPTPTPAPTPADVAPPIATDRQDGTAWLWPAALAAVILIGAALWFARRRKANMVEGERSDYVASEPPAPTPTPAAAPPPPQAPAAPQFLDRAKPVPATPPPVVSESSNRLSIVLVPLRAGTNMLSATAECEVVVTNRGVAPAEAIRLDVRLLSAHAGQDAELDALFAQPIGRPATPPFALAPGEERRVRTIAALPRTAIRELSAAGRPMFVPLLSVNLLYTTEGAPAQTAQAFAIGVEREGSAKLAPFWLDVPTRMYDALGARAHGRALER